MSEEYANKYNPNANQHLVQARLVGCKAKQRTKEVPDALASLNQSISVLNEQLTELYGVLAPVINHYPQPESPKEAVNGNCEMSRRIYELTISVKEMTRDVITVRNSLEV